MKNYIVTSDSTCDLTTEQLTKFGIIVRPLSIILGGVEHKDNIDITSKEVLDFVDKGGDFPKTAATSIEEYKEFFKPFVKEGLEVIHFCISEKCSSCYSNAFIAAKDFQGVYVVNSLQLSSGQGLLALKACDLLSEGKTVKQAFDYIESIKSKVNTSFLLDRLDYLHKGGRCSLTTLIGAKILRIHPYLAMIDGELKVKDKYPGNLINCYKRYVKSLADEYQKYDNTRCFITHCMADKSIIDTVLPMVKELFNFKEIFISEAGTTVSCHCGKNTLGVLFIHD